MLLGRPLQVDAAISDFHRPSVARVLVQLDTYKPRVLRIWIGHDSKGFWQKIEYKVWPDFCQHCGRIGQNQDQCFKKHPELRLVKERNMQSKSMLTQAYVAKMSKEMIPASAPDKLHHNSDSLDGHNELLHCNDPTSP